MAKLVKLGDVCTVVSGSTPKTSVEEYWNGDVKWITPAELDSDSYYVYDTVKHISELGQTKTGLSYITFAVFASPLLKYNLMDIVSDTT